jgi:hypothetical protein
MASLSSFINPSHYTRQTLGTEFLAGMICGATYSNASFTGANGPNKDPGGLFGLLLYSRSNTAYFNPAKGFTTDKYIVYTNSGDLVNDLNKLSGITNCLLSSNTGASAAIFTNIGSEITPTKIGYDFLHSINYLAYGGSLVIAGETAGFNTFQSQTGKYLDVIIAKDGESSIASWLNDQPYCIGIFPTETTNGLTGSSQSMRNFSSLAAGASLLGDYGKRIFNIYGTKSQSTTTEGSNYNISSLYENGSLSYTITTATDVAGFAARAKDRNEQYLTIGGLDRAVAINGTINDAVDWSSSTKTTLRNARVNFFVTYTPRFLGSDLVGATAGTTVTVGDRIGPARMKLELTKKITDIGLKYSFDINNATTREAITSEIQTSLEPYNPYLQPSATQIICDSSNNTDNSSILNIKVIIKPLLGVESFTIDINLTQ